MWNKYFLNLIKDILQIFLNLTGLFQLREKHKVLYNILMLIKNLLPSRYKQM